MIKGIIGTVCKTGLELMKVGAYATANHYTGQEMRSSANHLVGEVSRGANHAGRKLKIIRD